LINNLGAPFQPDPTPNLMIQIREPWQNKLALVI